MTDGSLIPEGEDLLQGIAPVDSHAPAYQVLARKYRPTTFDDLIGQETMVRILERAFELNRIAHAFMLTGVRGVGKTTTARIIARALNCVGPDGKGSPTADPCGVCPECKAILADRHPDVLELDAASQRGIDDARAVIEATRYPPMQARKKVFIIDEVHMLTKEAFNALLKTLEEPPPNVVFIFATTELRKVPVTVLSRCQRFDLKRVSQDRLARHFHEIAEKEGTKLSEDALNIIANAADGSVRDGLSLLDQAIIQGAFSGDEVSDMLGLADRGLVYDLLEGALRGDVEGVLKTSDDAYAKGADLFQILGDLMSALNTVARLKVFSALRKSNEMPELERKRGGILADQLSQAAISRCWQILRQGLNEVEGAPDRKQAAEMVLIRMCYASTLPTPDKLIARLKSGKGQISSEQVAPVTEDEKKKSLVAEEPTLVAPKQPAQEVVEEQKLDTVPVKETQQSDQDKMIAWRDIVSIASDVKKDFALYGNLASSVGIVSIKDRKVEVNLSKIPDQRTRSEVMKGLRELLKLKCPDSVWEAKETEKEGKTLAQFSSAAQFSKLEAVQKRPFVQQILNAFPGAKVESVEDDTLDQYALPVYDTSESLLNFDTEEMGFSEDMV